MQIVAKEIVFILDNLVDYQSLLTGISKDIAVYVLDAQGDALSQIAAITAEYSNLSAIHLLSHGSSGTLDLGLLKLTEANLNDNADTLAQIGASLDETGGHPHLWL